jgi:DNA repair protein RecO (recombination protein O)
MPRLIVKTKAIVMRSWRMGETSKLVSFYSEDYGKIKVTAKGARKPKSKFGAALELLSEVQAVFYFRDERDLQTLSECDLLRSFPTLVTSLDRLSFGSAACELVDRLTIEHEANKRLYGYLAGVLGALEEVGRDQLESLFWYFQLRLADALGYRPELNHCVSCRTGLEGSRLWFSAALGGGLCEVCGPQSGNRIGGDSLKVLSYLQGLKAYHKEAIPATPAQAPETRGMLRAFLEYHAGAYGRLKSLEFLEAISREELVH